MKYILEMLCFPPGLNIGIALLSLVVWWRWRRAAMVLLIGGQGYHDKQVDTVVIKRLA